MTTEAAARARIDRAVRRARLVLVWEALWPRLAPIATLAALFAALSWLGLWRYTGAPVRFVVLALFAVAFLAFLIRLARFPLPSRAAAFARVEQATGAEHRPATSFSDRLASAPDPTADVLWAAHRRRLLAALRQLRVGTPRPRLDRHDPYALRFLVAILFVLGLAVAGPELQSRIGEAFVGGEPVAATLARIDAWVTPPAYTGRPPIFLTGDAAKPSGTEYTVPEGSVVTVRTGGVHDLEVVATGDGASAEPLAATPPKATTADASTAATAPLEHTFTLTAAASVAVRKNGRDVSTWHFKVEPDTPPAIALAGDPTMALSGALHLAYTLEDDYGVVGARAEFAPLPGADGEASARPLYDAPEMVLSLPQLRVRQGTGETTRDLTSHPWAGTKVRMTLVAKDEAGQEGKSAPFDLTLPARRFSSPLARALVEQRAKLALDANAADSVADALDALTMVPEKGIADAKNYLAVRAGYYRLVNARDDDDLRGVVDYLWAVALGIEDGGVSLAADQLRSAEDALRKALENNASDEEIARLTQQLRDAMQKYLQALADQMQKNPQAMNRQLDPNAQMLSSSDLQKMLDQIQNLAKTGARDAARQLLSQLQNMMENLQAGQTPNSDNPNSQAMMQSLDKLGDLIKRQEDLMNRTFNAQNGQKDDGQPMSEQELSDLLKQLENGQQSLADALSELQKQLEGMGLQPGKLDGAGQAMGRATQNLGNQNPGSAVGDQSSALDALRQGAQGLAQQMARQPGQGGGMGLGMNTGGFRGGNGFQNTDPLGRQRATTGPDLGATVKVPDAIDTQRAREILDAIRKRLGDIGRPLIERDYLERLLQQF